MSRSNSVSFNKVKISHVFAQTNSYYLDTLKTCFPIVIICFIPTLLAGEYFYSEALGYKNNPFEQNLYYTALVGQTLASIFMSTILVLIVPLRMHEAVFKKKPQSFLDFSKQYFWPLFLEQLRVLGSILLRTLLFIIPGIHRMFRLSMVPYVVYFSGAYKADKVDALEYSNHVVKGYTFFVFVVSIMEYLTLYGLENLLEKQGQLSHIEITLFTQSIGVLVSTYSYCLLLMLYLLRTKGVDRTE